MIFFRRILLFVMLGLTVAGVQMTRAQVTIEARADTQKMLIGDHLKVWLEAKMPARAGTSIAWPQFGDSLHGLEWIEKSPVDTIRSADSIVYRQELTFTAFDSGTYYVPSFTFSWSRSKGAKAIFHTDSLPIRVQTVAVDTTRPFKPIKDIAPVTFSWLDYWDYILGGLLLLILILAALYYFYKKKRAGKQEVSEQVPPEKAHERALRLLKELDEQRLWQSGKVKEYYASLSYILRNYLDNRFGVKALELTTKELLRQIKKDRDIIPLRPLVKRVLQTSDLVKYAREEPLPEEQVACRSDVLQVIEKTKIIEEEGSGA